MGEKGIEVRQTYVGIQKQIDGSVLSWITGVHSFEEDESKWEEFKKLTEELGYKPLAEGEDEAKWIGTVLVGFKGHFGEEDLEKVFYEIYPKAGEVRDTLRDLCWESRKVDLSDNPKKVIHDSLRKGLCSVECQRGKITQRIYCTKNVRILERLFGEGFLSSGSRCLFSIDEFVWLVFQKGYDWNWAAGYTGLTELQGLQYEDRIPEFKKLVDRYNYDETGETVYALKGVPTFTPYGKPFKKGREFLCSNVVSMVVYMGSQSFVPRNLRFIPKGLALESNNAWILGMVDRLLSYVKGSLGEEGSKDCLEDEKFLWECSMRWCFEGLLGPRPNQRFFEKMEGAFEGVGSPLPEKRLVCWGKDEEEAVFLDYKWVEEAMEIFNGLGREEKKQVLGCLPEYERVCAMLWVLVVSGAVSLVSRKEV